MLIFIVQDRQQTLSPSHHLALYSKRLEALRRETKINLYLPIRFYTTFFLQIPVLGKILKFGR